MGWYSVYQILIGILFTWTEIVYENHHKTIDLKNNVDRRQGAALRDEGKSSTLKKKMQAVRMHVDANNMSNILCAFVFECYTFLGSGNCDLESARN